MSQVRIKSPNGTVYVYESKSYWDKELKAPRNKRVLIGKVDETTGEVVPTRKRKSTDSVPMNESKVVSALKETYEKKLQEKDDEISAQRRTIQVLKARNKEILESVKKITDKYGE